MLIFHVKDYDSLRRYIISKDKESSSMQKQSMLSDKRVQNLNQSPKKINKKNILQRLGRR